MANNQNINIDPLFGPLPYHNIGPHSLTIHHQILDDLWSGVAGKHRFLRAPHQQHYRFLWDQEFYLYTHFFVVPLLENRLNNGQNNYIWLSVLIRYEQVGNPDDVTERWSSWRCRHWFSSFLYNRSQIQEKIRTMISQFSEETYGDIVDMTSDGSGNKRA